MLGIYMSATMSVLVIHLWSPVPVLSEGKQLLSISFISSLVLLLKFQGLPLIPHIVYSSTPFHSLGIDFIGNVIYATMCPLIVPT